MKTAVVILNWNTENFLKKFLPFIVSSIEGEDAEIVVADNASTDGSLAVMKEYFPDIKTIAFDRNYGYTGGYNRALKQIDAEYFILMNSDIEVPESWLKPLVEWMDSHKDCGACAPKLRSWYEREKFEYAGAAGGFIDKYCYPLCRGRIMGDVETDNGQYDDARNVFWASGACLMVRSEAFRKAGGLDERFFAHMEEIDLCWRMQLLGYKISYVPESVVYHLGGGTLPQTSPRKLYLNYRNNLLMIYKNAARTFGLRFLKEGQGLKEASERGRRQAGCLIRKRMFLDRMSAVAYALTFKWKKVKAVHLAHKDYKNLVHDLDSGEIYDYLKEYGKKAEVIGMLNQSIFSKFLNRTINF